MNWIVYHIASGHAFFTGAALIIIAALVSTRTKPIAKRIAALACLVGAFTIVISSTAIPYWYYALAIAATITWAASRYFKKWRRWAPFAVIAVWVIAAGLEIPYHVTPTLNPASSRSITVIADSVTAGMGGSDKSEKWPTIVAKQHGVTVQDISHMGETAASALKRAKLYQITAPVVVVQIGGNDILGSTTSAQFASDLDALLEYLAAVDRQIVMFELPLPPFCHEYGRVQRVIAAKHSVILIPKRVFFSVIAGRDSTLDTIHLSQSGHQFMADCVWRLVQSAFDTQGDA